MAASRNLRNLPAKPAELGQPFPVSLVSWARLSCIYGKQHTYTYTHTHTVTCQSIEPLRDPLGLNGFLARSNERRGWLIQACGRPEEAQNMRISMKRRSSLAR